MFLHLDIYDQKGNNLLHWRNRREFVWSAIYDPNSYMVEFDSSFSDSNEEKKRILEPNYTGYIARCTTFILSYLVSKYMYLLCSKFTVKPRVLATKLCCLARRIMDFKKNPCFLLFDSEILVTAWLH